jgi:signal transduction histidine kinase/CheY-like chemotaxis protein
VPERECFAALHDGASGTCISRPYADPATGRNLFALSRRLDDGDAFNGVAQVAISTDYFLNLWGEAAPNTTDAVMLARADGTILAQYPPPRGAGPFRLADDDPLMRAIGEADEGVLRDASPVDGTDRILVYKKVAGYPAYVVMGLDKDAVLVEWHRHILAYGVFALAAILALMLAAGMALRRAQRERRALALWRAEVKEREAAQAQLLQSQKMESIGQLTGGVAHDFNNLLTAVIGNIDMVLLRVRDDRSRRLLVSAQSAAESAVGLTQRLLAFARKQHLQPQSVDLHRLVGEMEDMLVRTLGPAVRLSVTADPELWPALVDRNQLELVILNLAINARDAMERGGSLTVSLSNRLADETAPAELAPGPYVVVTMTDTGTGMDEATLARAIEPFYTTKEVGKGTGLGLSMVHGILVQSGGALRIRSRLGEGTTVEGWLPRAAQAPGTAASAEAGRKAQGSGTVLLCEDTAAVRAFVSDSLEDAGYAVIATGSGAAALDVLDAGDPVDLLIADFAMPEMNGGILARLARERRPDLPVLLITGNADQAALRADATGLPVLRKPFKQAQLVARVAHLLNGGAAGEDRAVASGEWA